MLPSFPNDRNGTPIPALSIGSNTELDGTSASAASAVFDANADTIVRICAVGDIRVAVGTAPAASTTSMSMAAGTVEYVRVLAGDKIAVLGGKATLTVMA